ncbi:MULTISPECIES: FMN reductase [unclassified Streptomyces]|uniref:FMN reductase n=1 Tax=unclassified Streptomyces TaxID=2593676 RepID=UPI0019074968|nr:MULTISPECIES: FMN reductase [unclassified Streptomyces]MCU4749863.1 FMN reductase [Streptomyces sp. G-5]QQN76157.1 FMN reductase [Streptomyces sp. XC 2026]
MTTPLKLTVITAGLGKPSTTRLLADRLAEATAAHLEENGREVTTRVIELRELAGDIAQHLVTGFPGPALRDALDATTGADGIIAVTPVFNASYSGLFKSYADLLEADLLAGRPVLVGATGGSARHSLVLDHAMRPLFGYLRTVTVPTGVYAASEDWGGGTDPLVDRLPERIRRAGRELAALMAGATGAGAGGPAPASAPVGEREVIPFAEQLAALRPQR